MGAKFLSLLKGKPQASIEFKNLRSQVAKYPVPHSIDDNLVILD